MRLGLIGQPLAGKSTVFRVLTLGHAAPAAAGAKRAKSVGVVQVPDERVDALVRIFTPRKIVPAQVEFADAAAPGGSTGAIEGALAALADADAAVLVLRGFENPAVPAPPGGVEPVRDLAEMETSMLVADLTVVERRLERVRKEAAGGKKTADPTERAALERAAAALTAETPIRALDLPPAEERALRGFQLASMKPLLALVNVGSPEDVEPARRAVEARIVGRARMAAEAIAAQTELEILELPEEERASFRAALDVAEEGSRRVIRRAYELLGLMSFFTGGPDEVRAWTVRRGVKAPEAAGVIHSDMQRGFIRAEVTAYADMIEDGSLATARASGHLRVEGRDYVVQDGDVLEIRFSV